LFLVLPWVRSHFGLLSNFYSSRRHDVQSVQRWQVGRSDHKIDRLRFLCIAMVQLRARCMPPLSGAHHEISHHQSFVRIAVDQDSLAMILISPCPDWLTLRTNKVVDFGVHHAIVFCVSVLDDQRHARMMQWLHFMAFYYNYWANKLSRPTWFRF
jgi:hypothetical protein